MTSPRPSVDSVTLDLPLPVSANRLWAGNGQGAMRKTGLYKAWLTEAGYAINVQNPGCVRGPYRLSLFIGRRKKADLGNFEKGLSDLLQAQGVIQNDHLAEEIRLKWADDIDGCRVIVTKAECAEGAA